MLRSIISAKANQLVLQNLIPPPQITVPVATIKANKHWLPKWKPFRRLKVIKIDYPDFYGKDKPDTGMSPDEIRSKMKEKGLQPPRHWQERTFDISCTGDVFEPYVPPEGDGKMSLISVGGAKQVATRIDKKRTSYMTVRKIRSYDEDFDTPQFVEEAQKIYLDLHTAMAQEKIDRHLIRDLVTERAYPEVISNLYLKTLKWQFLESIEPGRVVHGRHTSIISKDNIFAQLTVRFHTKQVLAVYDRFGRLCHGNPYIGKDVLEYVVFEKHLSNTYSSWRIHHKIIPSWMHIAPQVGRTFIVPPEPEPEPPKSDAKKDKKVISSGGDSPSQIQPGPSQQSQSGSPQLAAA